MRPGSGRLSDWAGLRQELRVSKSVWPGYVGSMDCSGSLFFFPEAGQKKPIVSQCPVFSGFHFFFPFFFHFFFFFFFFNWFLV